MSTMLQALYCMHVGINVQCACLSPVHLHNVAACMFGCIYQHADCPFLSHHNVCVHFQVMRHDVPTVKLYCKLLSLLCCTQLFAIQGVTHVFCRGVMAVLQNSSSCGKLLPMSQGDARAELLPCGLFQCLLPLSAINSVQNHFVMMSSSTTLLQGHC